MGDVELSSGSIQMFKAALSGTQMLTYRGGDLYFDGNGGVCRGGS